MAKCGSCEKQITSLRYKPLDAKQAFGTQSYRAIALCCPFCDTVFSAQFDPIAVKTDTVNEVVKQLKKPF